MYCILKDCEKCYQVLDAFLCNEQFNTRLTCLRVARTQGLAVTFKSRYGLA